MKRETRTTPPRIVRVSGVHKSYGSPPSADGAVLSGVDLTLDAGEFVALTGASGSGKTTLLNLIGGLDVPDAGTIEVAGKDLHQLADKQRSEFRLRHIGFVFQFFNLLPHLTARENISLPLQFLGNPRKEVQQRVETYASEVGLAKKLDHRIGELSGGEMQRVALARALVHNPSLLLADEPTGNLDSRTGATILKLIRETATSHDVAVLMATHDQAAAEIADRVVDMRDGKILGVRRP